MTIQIPSSHVVSCCAPRETEQMQHEIKKNQKFNYSRYVALNSPDHSPFDSRRYAAASLWDSRSDWLKSEAEHYKHCYQRNEKASFCLCLHKWPIIRIFTVSSCTTGQLDKLSTKVLEIWIKCVKYALF